MSFLGAIFTLLGVFTFPRLTFGIVLICFGQVTLGIIVIIFSIIRLIFVVEKHAEIKQQLDEYAKLKEETNK